VDEAERRCESGGEAAPANATQRKREVGGRQVATVMRQVVNAPKDAVESEETGGGDRRSTSSREKRSRRGGSGQMSDESKP